MASWLVLRGFLRVSGPHFQSLTAMCVTPTLQPHRSCSTQTPVTLYMEITVFRARKNEKAKIGTLTSLAPWKYVWVWYIILPGIIYQDDTSLIFPKIMRCWVAAGRFRSSEQRLWIRGNRVNTEATGWAYHRPETLFFQITYHMPSLISLWWAFLFAFTL